MRAVFLDWATVDAGDLDPTRLKRAVDRLECFDTSTPEEVETRLKQAEAVLVNKIALTGAHFDGAPQLELIALAATGTNNVDLDAAAAHGIAVCNITNYCTESVAQHVFALVLALNRRLDGYRQLVREGAWRNAPQFCLLDYPIHELTGGVFGVVGFGALGQAASRVARALGMRVLIGTLPGRSDGPGRVSFENLLRNADVLSLHCPMTAETRNLIGAAELSRMKPTALLINTARGGLVDSAALAEALRSGTIAGAGIDVLRQEPPPANEPLLEPDIPNLILTPHVAWASRAARAAALDEMAANIESYRAGGRRNRVV